MFSLSSLVCVVAQRAFLVLYLSVHAFIALNGRRRQFGCCNTRLNKAIFLVVLVELLFRLLFDFFYWRWQRSISVFLFRNFILWN